MPDREKERRILEAKIAGTEQRQANLHRTERPGAARSAQDAILDGELLQLRQQLKALTKD